MKTITLEEHFTTPLYLEATKELEQDRPSNPRSNNRTQAIQQKQADLGEGRLADMDAAGIADAARSSISAMQNEQLA